MGFNESVHAFIAARYYVRLQEAFGTRAEPAFIHAVQYYAGQRGRRMAQRAIREGKPLTPRDVFAIRGAEDDRRGRTDAAAPRQQRAGL